MKNKIIIFLISFCCASLLGAIYGCKTNINNSINVGAILPLSGKMANYGKSSHAALQAMLEVINNERKEKSLPLIELIIEDDQMEVKGGVNSINKLIQKDKVPCVIGPYASSITLGVAPIAEQNKTVIISPGSTSTDISSAGDYIFRTVLSGEYESRVSASLYQQLYNGKNLAVMYINNDYGINLKDNFLKTLSNANRILEIPYDEKETQFVSFLTKIKAAKTEVIYLIGYNEMMQIYQQAKELNLNVKWLGTAQLGTQSLIDQIGSSVEGTIFPSWELNLDAIKTNNTEFYTLFQKYSDNAELDPFAANAVDALSILNSIIKDKPMTGEEIKNELYKVKDFKGITGVLSFDKNGDVLRTISVKTIHNGKIEDFR